jgi:hypothetical protein
VKPTPARKRDPASASSSGAKVPIPGYYALEIVVER